MQHRAAVTMAAALATAMGAVATGSPSVATPLPGATGCPTFPADSFWHADVSALPVHPQSATWTASIGTSARLKADFGSGSWNGGPIGIPFTTVGSGQPMVPVSFQYAAESDPGPYPIPPDAPIEGGAASTGDRHVLVVDRDACRLWELYSAYPQNAGAAWTAGSGATWDLRSNAVRPLGWTSADAAGLPILAGLVRADEVAAGAIDHVIRFTAPRTADASLWPASHRAATGGPSDPPMGAWFRLKAGFDISGFSPANKVILAALKTHGMVLADNGSPWFLSGAPDPAWNDDNLSLLRTVPGSAFEAVDVSSLEVSPSSYATNSASPSPTTTAPSTTTTTPTTTTPTTTTAPTTTTTTVAAANLVANPGFETSLAGWGTGTNHTALARTCVVAHSGTCAAQLGRKASTGDAVIDDSPNTVSSSPAGAVYEASGWVKAPAGRSVTIRVREYRGTSVVGARTASATATGGWQALSVLSTPVSGGSSVSLDVIVSLTPTQKALVDDLALKRT